MEAISGGAVEMAQSRATGLATFIATKPGRPIPTFASPTATAEQRGRQFLMGHGQVLGVTASDQVQLNTAPKPDALGMEHVRFRQVHNGIPVSGGEIIVHMRGTDVTAVSAKTLPDLGKVPTTPTVSPLHAAAKAKALLIKHLHVADAKLSTPKLEIFNRGLFEGWAGPSRLAWFIEATKLGVREQIWIDAQRGAVLLHYSQIADAKNRLIYNTNSSSTLPGTLVRNETGPATGDADSDNAFIFAGDTYDFYYSMFGRDSFDNAGGTLISTTHYCPDATAANCPYKNAFWDGTQMVYGEGFSGADDVDAHELTHAVTERTAHLAYYMESGALNESFSDIFGESVDLTNGKGTDTPAARWLLAEDIPGIGPFRSMMNPNLYGDPGKVSDTQFVCNKPGTDSGGVHYNSGVPNHAFALMVDGGVYNNQTVTGIGLDKADRIQYRALTQYLVPTADFQANYTAVQQACTDLIGSNNITASDCAQVKLALDSVEMNSATCSPVNVPAFCPTGQVATDLFNDNLENTSSGNWANTVITGTNHWSGCAGTPSIYCDYYPASGNYAFWGFDYDTLGDSAVAMTSSVAITSSSTHLQFNHSYNFENDGVSFYDGAVLEYSTDNGTTWLDAGSMITAGAVYGGAIYTGTGGDNPLRGRNGFVGDSSGYTASQLDLSSLAGKSARFRFRVGTDTGMNDMGWFVDDVRIYSCAAPPLPDFVVSGVTLTPTSPTVGGTYSASVTVKNQGTGAGTVGTLQLWSNQSQSQACGALGNASTTVGSLAAGASTTVTLNNIAVDASGSASKTLRVFVDSQCATSESNEANNQITKAYTTLVPDFVVTDVTLTPTSPMVGGTYSASVTVKNQGTGAGTVGTLQLWSNQSLSQACGAAGDASTTVDSLAAGASTTVTLNNIPVDASGAGSKTLRVFVDSQCATSESNDANNQVTKDYTTVTGPDFVISNIVINQPTPLSVKSTFSAVVTVKNQGTGAADGGYVDVWANQPASQTCPADGNAFAAVGTLAPGESKDITINNLNAGSKGTKVLRAFVDSSCAAAESNENNNQATSSYTVTSGADFVVTKIVTVPANPAPRTTFSAMVTVQNRGTQAGNGGYLDVWANNATAAHCPADGDNFASVGILNAGKSKTFTLTGLPSGEAGAKSLQALVDSYCQTMESNESNNRRITPYTVGP
jgi:Zn-dependent metalloprotease